VHNTIKSDTTAIDYTFADSSGMAFRHTLTRAFSFASYLENISKQLLPTHKLEIWDQAISFQLGIIANSEMLFAEGVEFHLIKKKLEAFLLRLILITQQKVLIRREKLKN
jgi:hypothetical protein